MEDIGSPGTPYRPPSSAGAIVDAISCPIESGAAIACPVLPGYGAILLDHSLS